MKKIIKKSLGAGILVLNSGGNLNDAITASAEALDGMCDLVREQTLGSIVGVLFDIVTAQIKEQ